MELTTGEETDAMVLALTLPESLVLRPVAYAYMVLLILMKSWVSIVIEMTR